MGSTLTVDNIVGATTAANVKLPAGAVLQMQTNSLSGNTAQYTGTAFTDTGLAVNITPKFATSKIFVLVTQQIGITKSASGDTARMDTRLMETNSSTVISATRFQGLDTMGAGNLSVIHCQHGHFQCSNTNALQFKSQARPSNADAASAAALFLGWYSDSVHNITVMEIAG